MLLLGNLKRTLIIVHHCIAFRFAHLIWAALALEMCLAASLVAINSSASMELQLVSWPAVAAGLWHTCFLFGEVLEECLRWIPFLPRPCYGTDRISNSTQKYQMYP